MCDLFGRVCARMCQQKQCEPEFQFSVFFQFSPFPPGCIFFSSKRFGSSKLFTINSTNTTASRILDVSTGFVGFVGPNVQGSSGLTGGWLLLPGEFSGPIF